VSAYPYPISGLVYDTDGTTLLQSVRVSLTNTTNTSSLDTTTNSSGEYLFDLANLSNGYSNGDIISLYVSYGRYYTEVLHTVDTSSGIYAVNLTISIALPTAATYCSVTEVRNYTKIQSSESSDLALNDMIKSATSEIDLRTGRTWKGIQTVTNQYLDGDDTDLLWLPKPDIQGVSSIAIDDSDSGTYTSVLSTNYFVYTDKNYVVLRKNAPINKFRAAPQSVKITYTYGNSQPTEIVRDLCVLLVADRLHNEPVRSDKIRRIIDLLKWKTYGLA